MPAPPAQARSVVIGGGVIGTSVAVPLAEAGVPDPLAATRFGAGHLRPERTVV